MAGNHNQLFEQVIEKSVSKSFWQAAKEWEIYDCVEDPTATSQCICGHEGIKYLFKIRNICNNNILFPIGSTCIKLFEVDDLYNEAKLVEKEFQLYHAVQKREFIKLKGQYFTRDLLKKLYNDGAFDTRDNGYDGTDDYEFLLKMFNKTNPLTDGQERNVRRIIGYILVPYIKRICSDKILKTH